MKDTQAILKILPESSASATFSEETMPPGLLKLVYEYIELSTQATLSDTEVQRLTEISTLAEYDKELNNWLIKIDENLDLISTCQKIGKKPSSLENFILEVKSVSPQDMTTEKLLEIAQKVEISEQLLIQHIQFKDSGRSCQIICSTSFGSIFVAAWKPGQSCQAHSHDNGLGVIYVFKGELTYYLCQEVRNACPSLKNLKTPAYRQIGGGKNIKAGEWVTVEQHQMHELANQSQENLVTLHFRFFTSSLEGKECDRLEENEQLQDVTHG